jgi:hypothetical protein
MAGASRASASHGKAEDATVPFGPSPFRESALLEACRQPPLNGISIELDSLLRDRAPPTAISRDVGRHEPYKRRKSFLHELFDR